MPVRHVQVTLDPVDLRAGQRRQLDHRLLAGRQQHLEREAGDAEAVRHVGVVEDRELAAAAGRHHDGRRHERDARSDLGVEHLDHVAVVDEAERREQAGGLARELLGGLGGAAGLLGRLGRGLGGAGGEARRLLRLLRGVLGDGRRRAGAAAGGAAGFSAASQPISAAAPSAAAVQRPRPTRRMTALPTPSWLAATLS